MNYIEAKIYTSRFGIEHVLNMLSKMGIDDAVIQDPGDVEDLMEKKNAYDWDYVAASVMKQAEEEPAVIFYAEDTEVGKNTIHRVKMEAMKLKSSEMEGHFGFENSLGRMYVEDNPVREEEWKDNWKEYFKPAKITERFVVKPSWETYETQSETELVIEIDPGMAFGTGTHETTTLCIELLEKYAQEENAVLDVGCGSGILSIAAALLGIKNILGVDIDPIAVEVSKENIARNGFEEIIQIQYGDLTKGIDYQADVVVANLMADLVMMLSEGVAKHLKEKGVFISSGILVEKKEQVSASIRKNGFEILEIVEKGEWCAIAARLQ